MNTTRKQPGARSDDSGKEHGNPEKIRPYAEFYRSLANASLDAVVVFGPDGRVTEINPAFEQIYGWTFEELANRRLDFAPPQEEQKTEDAIALARKGETVCIDTKRKTRSGDLIDVKLKMASVQDTRGNLLGTFEIHRDITEQNRTNNINKALYAISRAVHSTTGLNDLYRSIHRSLSTIIDTTNIYISSYNRKKNVLTCPYFVDEKDRPYRIVDALNSDSLNSKIIKTKKPLLLGEKQLIDLSESGKVKLFGSTKPKSWLGVPLLLKDQVIGVLAVKSYTTPDLYSQQDVELLESISHQIAMAIERKQAEKAIGDSEEKYRTIFEQSRDAIYITSPEGAPVAFNRATLELLGVAPEEMPTLQVGELYVDPKEREINNALIEKQGFIKDSEVHLRSRDGREMICLDTSTVWRDADGNVKGYIGTLRDITELRKTEEDLKKAKEEAEAATQAKSEFLANMSHEIRSPMNAILGLTHLALRTELNEKQYDYLSKIKTSSNALLGIINDILDFSKIEAGRLNMEVVHFDFDDVLHDLKNMAGIKAEEKGIELIFHVHNDVPRKLVGDPLRLGQVLLNLTTNAIKFTTKGHVLIETELIRAGYEGERVKLKFSVKDTGIGLSREQIGRLFRAFSQADTSTTRKFGGTGLGLAICKSLVEMMDGEISVESEVGVGSTFSFTAEFGVHADEKELKSRYENDLEQLKILVVDDNPIAREIICETLEAFSFEYGQVSSGEEAIAELENAAKSGRPYELVIMDWRMEGIDGIEASRRIKSSSDLAHIPSVLMVTAYGKEEVMNKAQQVGIEGYLIKPVDKSLLFETIMEVLGKKREAIPKTSSQDEAEEIAGMEDIRGSRILLVEDLEINQQVARELLEDAGFVVTIANNGKEAVEMLKEIGDGTDDGFDVVLMDVQMPEMDGYTATGIIRGFASETKDIPIVAMTAYAMSGEREKCLEAGMNDHVAKPIDPPALFTTLVKWIKPGRRGPYVPSAKTMTGKKTAVSLPDELEGIDIKAGLERVAGNQTLYSDLLLKFGKKHYDADRQIGKALDAADFEKAKQIAHMIKGTAGNLGANALHATAGRLEAAVIQKDIGIINRYLESFSEVLGDLNATIKRFENEYVDTPVHSSTDSGTVDTSRISTLLNEIMELISSDYGEAIEKADSLESELGGAADGDIAEVKSALEEFDEEAALEKLKAIAGKLNIPLGGVEK